jgi:hypothetical protein
MIPVLWCDNQVLYESYPDTLKCIAIQDTLTELCFSDTVPVHLATPREGK